MRIALRSFIAFVVLLLLGISPSEAKKPTPCAESLDACPAWGCAKAGSADALTNEVKRTRPTATAPVRLTLDDFEMLQEQADNLVGQKVSLKKGARSKLKTLSIAGGQVGEGDLVEIAVYIVGIPHPNKGESVNCRLTKTEENDFHINVAGDPGDTEFDGIVVEMIPQNRPSGWTTKKLRRVAKKELQVLVRGQLFYDNKHVVNNDPIDTIGGQPKRFSLWEIHPVTGFYVCAQQTGCDPSDITQWNRLETWDN